MSIKRKIIDFFEGQLLKLTQQQWFVELKGKWEELDSKNRTYLQYGGVALSVLIIFIFLVNLSVGVSSMKDEFIYKQKLADFIIDSNSEIKNLKISSRPRAADNGRKANWTNYIKQSFQTYGIGPELVNVNEKQLPISRNKVKETLINVSVDQINLKQIVKVAFDLENGTNPMMLRGLHVKTRDDKGFLKVAYTFSGFDIKKDK